MASVATIVDVDDPALLRACIDLRIAVFVDEQNVPLDEEVDGYDRLDRGDVRHLALVADGAVVGTARLILNGDEGNVQRVVNDLKEDEFKIVALLEDGEVKEDFGDVQGDDWKEIRAIQVKLESKSGRKLSSEFFPRNALSR